MTIPCLLGWHRWALDEFSREQTCMRTNHMGVICGARRGGR